MNISGKTYRMEELTSKRQLTFESLNASMCGKSTLRVVSSDKQRALGGMPRTRRRGTDENEEEGQGRSSRPRLDLASGAVCKRLLCCAWVHV